MKPQNKSLPFSVKSKTHVTYAKGYQWEHYDYEESYLDYGKAHQKPAMVGGTVKGKAKAKYRPAQPISSSLAIAAKNLKVAATYKSELAATIAGGSFLLRREVGPMEQIMVCQKDLLHSVARLMFANSSHRVQGDWPIVLNQLSMSYRLVFESLDLDLDFYERAEDFVYFKVADWDTKIREPAHELYYSITEFQSEHCPI